jgi:hypothetical protein
MDSIWLTAAVFAMSDVQKLAGAGLLVCLALMVAIALWKPREKRARLEKSKPVPSLQEPKVSRRDRRRAEKAAAAEAPAEDPGPGEATVAGDDTDMSEPTPGDTEPAPGAGEALEEEPIEAQGDVDDDDGGVEVPDAGHVPVPDAPTPDWWVTTETDTELPMIFTEEQAAEAARRALIWAKVAEAHGADPSELPLRHIRLTAPAPAEPAATVADPSDSLAGQVIEAEIVTPVAPAAEEPDDGPTDELAPHMDAGEPDPTVVSLDGQYVEAAEIPAPVADPDQEAPAAEEPTADHTTTWDVVSLDGQTVSAEEVVPPAPDADADEVLDDQDSSLALSDATTAAPDTTDADEVPVVPLDEQFVEAAVVEPPAPETLEAEVEAPVEATTAADDDTVVSQRRSSRRDAAAARRRERALAKAERNARRANRGHDVAQTAEAAAEEEVEVDHRSLDLPEPIPQR